VSGFVDDAVVQLLEQRRKQFSTENRDNQEQMDGVRTHEGEKRSYKRSISRRKSDYINDANLVIQRKVLCVETVWATFKSVLVFLISTHYGICFRISSLKMKAVSFYETLQVQMALQHRKPTST
jgi:hypothetical protein